MKSFNIGCSLLLTLLIIWTSHFSQGEGQCQPRGSVTGIQAPADKCDPSGSECCNAGESYPVYYCSPPVSGGTKATLTLNSFEAGGDGGGPSECDGKYHSNNNPIVALSTGWYSRGSRCGKEIIIRGNRKSVRAKVVDECDSTAGCDDEHGYQPPCRNNIVDGSMAVWRALGVPRSQWGELQVTWSDA